MKVGYVLKSYPRLSQTFVVNELLAHERAGQAIAIAALRPPRDEPRHASVGRVRAPVTYLPGAAASGDAFWRALRELAARRPQVWSQLPAAAADAPAEVVQGVHAALWAIDHGVAHLHAHFGNLATAVARMAARFAGITYSFTAHAIDLFHEDVDPAVLARKLDDASGVVTVSDFNRRFLETRYGPAARRVRRVYNGLDLDEFAYAPPDDRPPTIVAVGRLVEKKGFADLISACRILRDRGQTFRCLIVGDGPLDDALRAQIARERLDGVVELGGVRPQEDVQRLIRSAACLAAPCTVGADGDQDGLPTVLLEALALGTPCVATDVTGIPEAVRDGDTGLVVPQRAPAALADALQRLLGDPALRQALAARGRALVEREFDIHRNAALIRQLFAQSLAEAA